MHSHTPAARTAAVAIATACLGVTAVAPVAAAAADTSATSSPQPIIADPRGSRADVDGDGRLDWTEIRYVRENSTQTELDLVTRTARGRWTTTRVVSPYAERGMVVPARVWVGAAELDGARGSEVVLDLNAGIGDFPHQVVYTMRKGRWVTETAPGARSSRTPWAISSFPSEFAGYRFSISGGVRRVVASRLTVSDGKGTLYQGYRTSYRWGSHGWMSNGTVRVKNLPRKQAQESAGWHGVTFR